MVSLSAVLTKLMADKTSTLTKVCQYGGENITVPKKNLTVILYECLWGNKADLSFNPSLSAEDILSRLTNTHGNILIDDSEKFYDFVRWSQLLQSLIFGSQLKGGSIHFVVDNVGVDVLSDLVLSTLLTYYGHADLVVFHVKNDPMFKRYHLFTKTFQLCI